MAKKIPLNMENKGSILGSKHYVPSVMRCHELEPTAIKNGTTFSDKVIRQVWREMVTRHNASTTLSSFRNYMNVAATNKANLGRWSKYVKNGELKVIRQFFGMVA